MLVAGFADDMNLLVYGDTTVSVRRLEGAWAICEVWAKTRGMIFAPKKSEFIHFTRAQKPTGQEIRLSSKMVRPTESARFLGIWLDRKL